MKTLQIEKVNNGVLLMIDVNRWFTSTEDRAKAWSLYMALCSVKILTSRGKVPDVGSE
jgi:hypothetical protein